MCLETKKLCFIIRYRLLFHCGLLQCTNNDFTSAHSNVILKVKVHTISELPQLRDSDL